MPETPELRALKREIARARRSRAVRNRFAPKLRSRILSMVRELMANGETAASSAAVLGMSQQTLDKWLEREAADDEPRLPVLVPVVVEQLEPDRSFVLELGGGRITGLGLDDVAELVRRLR